MMQIYLDVDDEKYLDAVYVHQCSKAALKITQRWLTRESIRRYGKELRIRSTAGRRRVRKGKIKGSTATVWYGIRPLNLAYARNYTAVDGGVLSGGERFYKGAFLQSMNGSSEVIWRRTRDRPKQPKPRKKPLPKGQRRKRKSPPAEVVREHIDMEASEIVAQLEFEIQDVFKEAFLNELHQQSG
ncbi:hypothetical protein J7937_21605 [Vibrio parahaemolyticus]|nr:hypothetical protein [Vibrio parahaemolyticus]MCF9079940.1 hypothetical protein [Vibrio parahaemolyticus]